MKRIVLSADDLNTLINGGIVERDNVKIILSDIGTDAIQLMLNQLQGN